MTDEQAERLIAEVGRLATVMEGLLVVNTGLYNALTIVDDSPLETKDDPHHTMDG